MNNSGIQRLENEFEELIENDQMDVFDIMSLPDNLRKYELSKKLVFVIKKETKNMDKINSALFVTYPTLKDKKILFIDDEADYASVVYENNKEKNITELKVIAQKIENLRSQLSAASYLQVTATPYSLYLQPDDLEVHENKVYQPKRPAFTELVPIHDKYVGGEMYFENSKIDGHIASHLYHEVSDDELSVLKKPDGRRVKPESILTNKKVDGIRTALINFIVGGNIRNIQNEYLGKRNEKYAMIIHTGTSKAIHAWQGIVIEVIEEKLVESIMNDEKLFRRLIMESYTDLVNSKIDELPFPTFDEVYSKVANSLLDQELQISIVNSENDMNQLLDKTGQLKLRAPLNVFIGGQILDRGITIGNLIGFYYGRDPQTFQQDTVLQHSRMYGARPMEDIAVTRFYTTQRIYSVMEKMHEFDSELRKAFETGANESGVVFIQKDVQNRILPCSPNKIMLSSIRMLKPYKRMLPVGFQTDTKTKIKPIISKVDQTIDLLKNKSTECHEIDSNCFLVDLAEAKNILDLIYSTLVMDDGYEWDISEYKTIMNYLSKEEDGDYNDKVWLVIRTNRNLSRFKGADERYQDAPDSGKGVTSELKIAKSVAKNCPALILTKQGGRKDDGWRDAEFWWPVLIAPENTKPTVFANQSIK